MGEQAKADGIMSGQTKQEAAKFGPFLEHEHISRAIKLPAGYGKDRVVAMVRDPWWLFIYWEITPQRENALREQMQRRGQHFEKSILRIYDITAVDNFNETNAQSYFDITLKDVARNWYVDIGYPGRNWCIEIGLFSQQGEFYALARSNIVRTPRFGMSDTLDAVWMISEEEYWWLFGASGGFDVGKSSLEMKELFKKRLEEWIASGGVISLASHILQKR